MEDIKNGSIIYVKIGEKTYYNLVINSNEKYFQTMPIVYYNKKFNMFEDIISILETSTPVVELVDRIVDFRYAYSIANYTNHYIVGQIEKEQLRKILDCFTQYCLGNIVYSEEFDCLISKIEAPENGESENAPKKGTHETDGEYRRYNYDMIFLNNLSVNDVMSRYNIAEEKAKAVINLSKVMNSEYIKLHPQNELNENYEKLIRKFKDGKMSEAEIEQILAYRTYNMAYQLNIPWTKEQELKNIISTYRLNITLYSSFKSYHNEQFAEFVKELTKFAYKDHLWITMCDQREFISTLDLDQFLKYYALEESIEYAEPLYWHLLYKVNTNGSKNFHFLRFHSEEELMNECIVFIDSKKVYDYDKILATAKKYCIPYGYLYAKLSRIKEEK